jgi:2-polyprenyl-3-methyl-5-hydroxy-6-metoxy-1,4-benzoquinol methylase
VKYSFDDPGAAVNHRENYRKRIYGRYASIFQDATERFDVTAADKWGKAYRYYLREWLPSDPNASILEVGCGGGKMLHFLKSRGFARVSGVDISPEQVRLSRQVVASVEQADALEFLENHGTSYDLILGLDIVEHFRKDEVLRFLDACHQALKPDGRLVLQTPNADSPWGTMHRYNDFTHETAFNPNAIARLLGMIGFHSVEARELGPVPFGYSVTSTIRAAGWSVIRSGLKLWNLIETGYVGSCVLTRIFLVSGAKGGRDVHVPSDIRHSA